MWTTTFLVSFVEARALLYEGFVVGTNNAVGEYIANLGADSSGRRKFIEGSNLDIAGFSGEWEGLGGAQYELGIARFPR